MTRVWLGMALAAICAAPCYGQDRPRARATADFSTISLGDRLTLTVEVEHGPGQSIAWPAISDTLSSFEVVGVAAGQPVVVDGRHTSTRHYALTTFELGELEIPSVEVAVADSGLGEPLLISTEPISIAVESVGIDESGDIRTVKSPLEIPRNWLLLIPWVLFVGALAGLAYWLYRRYRARERTTGERLEPSIPARPPHEIAYEALNRLEAKRLLERGEIKQYFIEVSEIVRTYLEGRFPIDALEMTSYEVLRDLREVGLEPDVFDLFPPFFDRADLVKFAKFRPRPDVCQEMIPMARRLVDETRDPDRLQPSSEPVDDRDTLAVAAADGREVG